MSSVSQPAFGPLYDCIICKGCLVAYNNTNKVPLVLQCNHILCQACVSDMVGNIITCPECKLETTGPIKSQFKNCALMFLVYNVITEGITVENFKRLISLDSLSLSQQYSRCIEFLLEIAHFLLPDIQFPRNSKRNREVMPSLAAMRKLLLIVTVSIYSSVGRLKVLRSAQAFGERVLVDIIQHVQSAQKQSSMLWEAIKKKGCQFLGPALQEDILRCILLVLSPGWNLQRKTIVEYSLNRLKNKHSQLSRTSIAHVLQLLYRASCFKIEKRQNDSSMLTLKESCRTYDSLREQHDTEIVRIAIESGLRITPELYSKLLWGDVKERSRFQSILDKIQTNTSFIQTINELSMCLRRTGDPTNLGALKPELEVLACIKTLGGDESVENHVDEDGFLDDIERVLAAVFRVMKGYDQYLQYLSTTRYGMDNLALRFGKQIDLNRPLVTNYNGDRTRPIRGAGYQQVTKHQQHQNHQTFSLPFTIEASSQHHEHKRLEKLDSGFIDHHISPPFATISLPETLKTQQSMYINRIGFQNPAPITLSAPVHQTSIRPELLQPDVAYQNSHGPEPIVDPTAILSSMINTAAHGTDGPLSHISDENVERMRREFYGPHTYRN